MFNLSKCMKKHHAETLDSHPVPHELVSICCQMESWQALGSPVARSLPDGTLSPQIGVTPRLEALGPPRGELSPLVITPAPRRPAQHGQREDAQRLTTLLSTHFALDSTFLLGVASHLLSFLLPLQNS